MWALKLLLLLATVVLTCKVAIFVFDFINAGQNTVRSFRKGIKRYFFPSSTICLLVSGLFLIFEAPIFVVFIGSLVAFVISVVILLGNDEDKDQFTKL